MCFLVNFLLCCRSSFLLMVFRAVTWRMTDHRIHLNPERHKHIAKKEQDHLQQQAALQEKVFYLKILELTDLLLMSRIQDNLRFYLFLSKEFLSCQSISENINWNDHNPTILSICVLLSLISRYPYRRQSTCSRKENSEFWTFCFECHHPFVISWQ